MTGCIEQKSDIPHFNSLKNMTLPDVTEQSEMPTVWIQLGKKKLWK